LTTFGAHYVRRFEHLAKVTDEAGRELAFSHGRDEVVIQLREPAPPDKPVKVRFEMDGDFLVRPGGDSYWELGVWSWFPQPELCEQFFTFHALVKVKKPFIPFATGRTVRRAAEGDDNVLETREDNPIMWPVVLAGDYTFKDEVRDGVTIRVATYALKNDRAVKQLTDLSSTIIKFYSGFLGPFPSRSSTSSRSTKWASARRPPASCSSPRRPSTRSETRRARSSPAASTSGLRTRSHTSTGARRSRCRAKKSSGSRSPSRSTRRPSS
jgi:hypothetical protein